VDYLLAIAQGLFGAIALTMPGMVLLHLARGRTVLAWPPAFLLAASFVFSSLILAGVQRLSFALPSAAAARLVTWAFIVSTALYTVWKGWRLAWESIRGMGFWGRISLGLVAATVLFWIALMPLSPYPSHLTMGLGDPPAYYRAAANLVAGRGWATDYFVGDYASGSLSYLSAQPIQVLVTTFFFQVFGVNWHSLYVYDALAGGVAVCLLASFVCLASKESASDGRHIPLLTLAFLLLPTHFILFGLGVMTAPGALAFLTLAAFCIEDLPPARLRTLVIAACVVFLFWARPETRLLAVLLVAFWGVQKFLSARWPRASIRLGMGVIVVAVLWAHLPDLVDSLPQTVRGLCVFYVQYDPTVDRFVCMYDDLNRVLSRANFLGGGAVEKLPNRSLGDELCSYPVAFLRYLLVWTPYGARTLLAAVSVPDWFPSWQKFVPLNVPFAALFICLALERRNRLILAVMAIFLLLLIPVFNFLAGVRHVLAISPVLMALSLRAVLRRWGAGLGSLSIRIPAGRWLALAAVALVLFADARKLIGVRLGPGDRTYVPILKAVQEQTAPTDVIACNYPQLITCVTGRRSLGATWLTENLDLIIPKFNPDFVLIDNGRTRKENDYILFTVRMDGRLPGYEIVAHSEERQFVLLRSTRYRARSTKEG